MIYFFLFCTGIHVLTTLALGLADLCSRLLKAFIEYRTFKHQYTNEYTILKIALSYNTTTRIFYACEFFLLLFAFQYINVFVMLYADHQNIYSISIGMGLGFITCFVIGAQKCDLNNVYYIRNKEYLDFVSGFARSYYHGYLEKIIPSTGTNLKGLVERIEMYESTEQVNIPIKKFFVVVPKDFYLPPKLSQLNMESHNARRLEQCQSLEKIYIDVAGEVAREYSNSIYRLCNRENWYVCIEGAGTINTMHNSMKLYPDIKEMKHVLLTVFYNKLSELISNNPETKNLIELILYDSKDNLVDVIEERIYSLLNV